uniref:porin family protein n=1 Tax=Prevotella sp. TaxID=59823 RepID=UPI003FED6877
MNIKHIIAVVVLSVCSLTTVQAQIGEHRSDFAIGANGGYVLSKVGFTPTVQQKQHGGITGGVSLRYVCEKYFKTICSVYAEVNYAKVGWTEDILDIENNAVLISGTGEALKYQRDITYIQIPVFAHLAWGREERGFNFFVNLGPQIGIYLNESTTTNFDETTSTENDRVSNITAQYDMPVEKKLDYGIAAGAGMEYSIPKVGHFLLEGRYYYGLGNIYGSSKKDYFGKSNFGQIVVKASYLFDITRTKNVKRK